MERNHLSLDFVLGQRIILSNNHPCKDICDELSAPSKREYHPSEKQGVYPKDFLFEGWHPQCFCFVVPILVDEKEIEKMNDAFANGEEYTPKREQITEYPKEFRDFCTNNADKIREALRRGTAPYFVRNNAEIIDSIINPKTKTLTIAEKAKMRHDARTPEQISDIQQRWDARLKENAQIKATANNVLNVAKGYGDVDTSELESIIANGNLTQMREATKSLAQQVLKLKKFEQSISDLIPNAHIWHKQFSATELQSTYNAVEKKLSELNAKFSSDKQKIIDKLEWEANTYLGTNAYGAQSKYITWKVSQSAYLQKVGQLKDELYLDDVALKVPMFEKFKTTSAPYLTLVEDLKYALSSKDRTKVDAILKDL